MEEEGIRAHLRAALDEVIAKEKRQVSDALRDLDNKLLEQKEMLVPLISALRELENEVGVVEGLSISPAPPGHQIIIKTHTTVSDDSYVLSTTHDNREFEVRHSSNFVGNYSENRKIFRSAEELLQFAVEVVGKHIGAAQAHGEGNGPNK